MRSYSWASSAGNASGNVLPALRSPAELWRSAGSAAAGRFPECLQAMIDSTSFQLHRLIPQEFRA